MVGPWHAASLIFAKVADESEIIVKFKGTALNDSCCKIKSMPRREAIFFINYLENPYFNFIQKSNQYKFEKFLFKFVFSLALFDWDLNSSSSAKNIMLGVCFFVSSSPICLISKKVIHGPWSPLKSQPNTSATNKDDARRPVNLFPQISFFKIV